MRQPFVLRVSWIAYGCPCVQAVLDAFRCPFTAVRMTDKGWWAARTRAGDVP